MPINEALTDFKLPGVFLPVKSQICNSLSCFCNDVKGLHTNN